MEIAQRTKTLLRPPYGLQVRKAVIGACVAMAIPRFINPDGAAFIIPRVAVGIEVAIVGIILAITATRRLSFWGRLSSAIAFTVFVTLAFDTFAASLTSALIACVLALCMFGEAVAND